MNELLMNALRRGIPVGQDESTAPLLAQMRAMAERNGYTLAANDQEGDAILNQGGYPIVFHPANHWRLHAFPQDPSGLQQLLERLRMEQWEEPHRTFGQDKGGGPAGIPPAGGSWIIPQNVVPIYNWENDPWQPTPVQPPPYSADRDSGY